MSVPFRPMSKLEQIKLRFYDLQQLVVSLRDLLGRRDLSPAFKADVSAELYRLTEQMNALETQWDAIEGEDR